VGPANCFAFRKLLAGQMMMIDFITINSGLVPLIEGYALKSYILDLRLSVVCVHIFCFSFSKEKMC